MRNLDHPRPNPFRTHFSATAAGPKKNQSRRIQSNNKEQKTDRPKKKSSSSVANHIENQMWHASFVFWIVLLFVSSSHSLVNHTPAKVKIMKSLSNYLNRIGLPDLEYQVDRQTLAKVMDGQSRSISFENYDVVLGKPISMDQEDVETKLVDQSRGGYCWEQNTLMKMALEEIGFDVIPVLCRVRWGKPDDSLEPNTGFTHLALQVKTLDGGLYLADVGFAGTNSMEPVSLAVGKDPQELPEGKFRVVPSKHKDFQVLELLVKGDWRPLYEWRPEPAPLVDQIACNWFSCTYPTARFTSQFFCCRIIGNERHHILNNEYVIRYGHGVGSKKITEKITEKTRLLELMDQVFGVKLNETENIDRYL